VGENWYLDSFIRSKAGWKTLACADKLHPLGHWYAVAQTYDGKAYRAYVDGVLEARRSILHTARTRRVRVGARMNRISYFKGSIAEARFADRALAPEQFLRSPNRPGLARG